MFIIIFKRIACYFLFFVIIMGWQIQANAHSKSSTAQAKVNYATELAVQAMEPTILLDFSGMGRIDCDVVFTVIANTEEVQMYVEATDLHFSDSTKNVSAIPLNTSAGIKIDPVGAEGSRNAAFVGSGDTIQGLSSHKTEILKFASQDSLTFNHEVFVSLEWNQKEEQKPAGEYTANIRLTCFITP